MITFSKLIRIAPFDEETRKDILSRESTLSEDQKREITDQAWDLITAEYQVNQDTKLDDEIEKLGADKPFSEEIVKSVQSQMDMDFKKKLEGADTNEQIELVQDELKTHE
jgi:hypothetical protein